MKFFTAPVKSRPSSSWADGAYLIDDRWDDFHHKTLWYLVVVKGQEVHDIGGVKIGDIEGQLEPALPDRFDHLDESYFSLGQDEEYYENLNNLGPRRRSEILKALRDVALDLSIFHQVRKLEVTQVSLLRQVSEVAVQTQLHRMALGGVRLSPYSFTYMSPAVDKFGNATDPQQFGFSVIPEANPRTNVHVLIGRNGVGKSFMLHDLTIALTRPSTAVGELTFDQRGNKLANRFANVVSVAFSAFDAFEPIEDQPQGDYAVQYHYIGLKREGSSNDASGLKGPGELATDFSSSLYEVVHGGRRDRWQKTLEYLSSDPIFGIEIQTLFSLKDESLRAEARRFFGELSSGHKIVLLTLTRLVETVEEATLVLIDEPEGHLHPPLLAAFMMALSELLESRNAVAIIATHSPVVLQEVPSTCVYTMQRSGGLLKASRPGLETYGENVGTLTQAVFGLEVSASGFHRALAEAVQDGGSFEEVLERFGERLGGEARALLQAMTYFAERE